MCSVSGNGDENENENENEDEDEEADRRSSIFDLPRPSVSSSSSSSLGPSSSSIGCSIYRLPHRLLPRRLSALEERGRPRRVDPQSSLGLSASVDQPKERR